jgi:hypothetical protein
MSFNETIDTYLLNLKIISKIEENDKLITTDKLIKIDKPTILQGVHRWFGSESRDNTLEMLNQIYENSFDITDILLTKEKDLDENKSELEDSNSQIFQKFIIEFTNSLVGIDNLKKTYKNDILILSQLDMISNKINSRLEKMNDIFKIKLN